ncbi:MAG: DUF1566 domain-containing protein [Candidatus Berkelbacteria bacterium]|nr:DUF1566 domain-containing protein [Candidatus Berkelbacteria bacterium]
MKNKSKLFIIVAAVLLCAGSFGAYKVFAEQSGSTPESNATSRIKTLYTDLTSLTYGSDTDTPDWGAYWNRIKTAAKWVPTGNVAVGDVRSGKTFYNANRSVQTGNWSPASGSPCPTQQYYDGHASATQGNNCSLTWTTNPAPVAGDDNHAGNTNKDPLTGLTWSQYLKNNAGVIQFVSSSGSSWTWDASGAANVAVGNKTAAQLCNSSANPAGAGVWRLPTEKELMQAYIDGAFWNLTQPSYYYWSLTEYYSTLAYNVYLNDGTTNYSSKTNGYSVRCVR